MDKANWRDGKSQNDHDEISEIELERVYPLNIHKKAQELVLVARKSLKEFFDLKWPNIKNIEPFKIDELRWFGAAENKAFELFCV